MENKNENLVDENEQINFNVDFMGTGLRFPNSVIPEKLRTEIRAFSKDDEVLDTMVSHLVLAGMGAGLSNMFWVDVDNDGWKEKSNLFSIALANPGSNKSGVISAITRPFLDKQKAIDSAFEERLQVIERYNKQVKEMNKLHEKVDDYRDSEDLKKFISWMKKNRLYHLYNEESDEIIRFNDAPKPKPYELYNSGGTSEKRDEILATNNGRPLVIIRDEFKGFFNSFNQYKSGKGDDLDVFLTLFDYNPMFKSNRSERFFHDDRAVSTIGTSQFKVFSDMFKQGKNQDNGLIHRFLVVNATSYELKNPYNELDKWIKTDQLGEYRKFVGEMLGDYDNHEHHLTRLEIDNEAYNYMHQWRQKLNDLYRSSEKLQTALSFDEFSSFAGKYDRYFARFAIIMRALRFYYSDDPFERSQWQNPEKPINLEDIINAEKLVMYYMNTAINFLENLNPFGSSKIKDSKQMAVLDRMIPNCSHKLLITNISKVYGYKCKDGRHRSAQKRLNEMVELGLIAVKNTNDGKRVYNSKI